MDELLYGTLHASMVDYSISTLQQQAPGNMVSWGSCYQNKDNNSNNISTAVVGTGNIPVVYGSEQMGSGNSLSSDAASSLMVADVQRHNYTSEEQVSSAIRAKIASHPLYPKLLDAYIDCQKVGAPPELAHVLDEFRRESDVISNKNSVVSSCCWGADPDPDPELDKFMETYCDILVKYKSDLSKPFDEASSFLNNMQTQLSNLCNGVSRSYDEAAASSEEDLSGGEAEVPECSRTPPVDHEIKDQLIRKYGGHISTLKHEFSKKKKIGKLPKQAIQILFHWWNLHYKWPYPTEADKVALAESTGLDQRQINNWFINQRKRHWKPSESMQFNLMDSLYGPICMND